MNVSTEYEVMAKIKEIEYTEAQIEYMREMLISGGAGGCFGSANTPTYWEAEQIIEEFEKRKWELPY